MALYCTNMMITIITFIIILIIIIHAIIYLGQRAAGTTNNWSAYVVDISSSYS